MHAETIAVEEWRLLQRIIARKETIVFRIRGCCYLLLVVLGAAIFHARTHLAEWILLYLAYLVALTFFAVEVGQKVALRRAIDRSRQVEHSLREGFPYDGPRLGDTLSAPAKLREVWQCSGGNQMVWVPAAISLIAITVFAIHRWW